MKKLFLSIVLALVATGAFAQSGFDVSGSGGSIVCNGSSLQAPLSKSTFIVNDSTGNMSAATGAISLQTGAIASGDYQNSSTFGSGGSVSISATGTYDSISFSGVATSAMWQSTKLANGTYTYTLTLFFSDPVGGANGTLVLTTVNTTSSGMKFPGSMLISQIAIHFN